MNAGKGDKKRIPWSQDYADKFNRIFKKGDTDAGRKPDKKGTRTVPKSK